MFNINDKKLIVPTNLQLKKLCYYIFEIRFKFSKFEFRESNFLLQITLITSKIVWSIRKTIWKWNMGYTFVI